MRLPAPRLGLAAQLAVLLGGLAGVSTLIALLIQDRALTADLQEAAQARLQRAAVAADRLVADHLLGVADRYAAISRTPEFRANLEADHLPTLAFYARRLVEGQGAAAIAFLHLSGAVATSAGDAELAEAAVQRLGSGDHVGETVCATLPAEQEGRRKPADRDVRFAACRFPEGRAEASLFWVRGAPHTLTAVPLHTRGTLVGGLIAVEPIGPETFGVWSDILGATVAAVPRAMPRARGMEEPVRFFPGVELRVSITFEAEDRAIARSRRNLLLSGLAALVLALTASLFLARSFARPILRIGSAARRVGTGFLDPELYLNRRDELGDLGRAFNDIMSRLRGSELRLGRAQRLARLGHWSIDLATDAVHGGPEFRRLFGLSGDGPIAADDLVRCVHDEDRKKLEDALRRGRLGRGTFRTDVRVPLRPGRDRILHLRGKRRDGSNGGLRIEASAQDVTERWKTARRIRYLSLHDSLTGLGNREYFIQHLRRCLKQAGEGDVRLAVLTIGVNDLASITGAMGHAVADELLRTLGRRLVELLSLQERKRPAVVDVPAPTAMRVGNAEFATVVAVRMPRDAASLAKNILQRLTEPYRIGGEDILIGASVGISLWPDDGTEVDTLARNAHAALQQARRVGSSGRYQFYQGSIHEEATRRLRMANLLRRAIERGELELYYQPRVHPETVDVVAVEALARWNSAEFGQVAPSEFVPLAEEVGIVHQLGEWCLRVAASDLTRWHECGADDLRVSINISRLQLTRGIVTEILEATSGVDPSAVELEVTESALIERPEEALAVLSELGEHGFRISLDDFGTGYSSLSYIRQLPIDAVKIDRSFISEVATSEDAHAITWAIIMMCQALNLEAIAEGVETEAQRQRLIDLGCYEVQGYLFARPMSAAHLEQFLEDHGIIDSQRTVA